MSLPGPSSLGRVAQCIGSETLPHVGSVSDYAREGGAVHAYLAACVNVGPEGALIAAPAEYRERLAAIPLSELPKLDRTKVAAEVSWALDIKTGACRELGRGLKREEARALAKDGEMVGTADLVGLTADSAQIFDWKSGRGHVDGAEINLQTKSYALMAARAYGRDSAKGGIVRVLDDGTVWTDGFEMDSLDLDAHEAELRELMGRRAMAIAAGKVGPLVEGPGCRLCPALPSCPAKMTLLAAVVAPGEPLGELTVQLTPERAASAWAKLETAEKLVERLKAVVKDYARQSPFPTGDGYVLGEVTENREAIVADRARAVLVRHLGEQLGGVVYSESAEITTKVTKTALKSALSKFVLPTVPGGKITHIERETLEAIRQGGAMSVSQITHVVEHKAKEPPKAKKELPAPVVQTQHGKAWDELTPEGRIEHGRGATLEQAADADAKRRAERDRLLTECDQNGHKWGPTACTHCRIAKPPMDRTVDMTTGHPMRMGVKLCSCIRGGPVCVSAPAAEASP